MIPISKPKFDNQEKEAVLAVLDSGIIAAGPKVKEFESDFASFIGVKHAIAVSNGTCSLHTCLVMNGLDRGAGVITTPFTFIATANSILHAGCEPVFVDIKESSYTIDPAKIEEALKKDRMKRIKAIMIVHLYGQTCDMDTIMAIAKKYNVKVIEDAAQAHGATYKGQKAGSFADGGSFSMYATKNITTAEGGVVTTNDDKAAEIARSFINHGSEKIYYHTRLGYNYRMTDIEAAIGIVQLKKLDQFNAARRKNAEQLAQILKKFDFITPPAEEKDCFHIYHQYTIRVKGGRRDAVLKTLNDNGIGAKIFYPIPLHKQPFYV
ncbi:MAG: DegT/DnrJ/EryC1/StrS family aminotransferase, partial [Spirochaetia bacterium]|nr:DegT/DnrJ/EryC1/StrS family aminotransferase [Spirochaetia bacterium]